MYYFIYFLITRALLKMDLITYKARAGKREREMLMFLLVVNFIQVCLYAENHGKHSLRA